MKSKLLLSFAAIGAVLLILCLAPVFAKVQSSQKPTARVPIMESYPKEIQQRLDAREEAIRRALETAGNDKGQISAQYVLDKEWKWDAGDTLTVAFSGGTPQLRAKIQAAAVEWSKYANLKFDFRVHGKFREWSKTDQAYSASIRIAFEGGDWGGYWSALGKDSVKAYRPNEASMNFEGFPDELPGDYEATVKHEFGHAIGFWHEHQHPVERCDDQMRWNDDPGYIPTRNKYDEFVPDPENRKPGIYTVFGGPPNNWKKDKIDFAMKHINDTDSHAYEIGSFDPQSIMKYYYPAFLFLEGERSRCYHEPNLTISMGDRQGAAAVYPRQPAAIKRILEEKKRLLEVLLQSKSLTPGLDQELRSLREKLP